MIGRRKVTVVTQTIATDTSFAHFLPEFFVYIDVPRGLVFFDQTDSFLPKPAIVQYDRDSGAITSVAGAQTDDTVCDVSRDGRRLALASASWIIARNTNRSRLSFVADGAVLHQTDKFLSFWTRLDPSGRYALVSAFKSNDRGRPVVIDLDTGEYSDPIARDLDARFGDVDPVEGLLWAPDERTKNSVLTVNCRSGEINKINLPVGGKVKRLRFARDGSVVFVAGDNNQLLCCDRDGSAVWSRDIGEFGEIRSANMLFNESGSHFCLPLSETARCNWGEDLVIDSHTGAVEHAIQRHRAPPARLAADWFGDRLLTHGGEIVDFYTGKVMDMLPFKSAQ
ncbi:hypothetical protein [Burkholderia sp. D-99]|uniref:hypothetical protein n=1 Tax=Burkholderia sp. D-99 TaxID=2717316 RepID=UPI001AA0CAA6|nr:hypothetical protein [Burkholderia sp. D-99]